MMMVNGETTSRDSVKKFCDSDWKFIRISFMNWGYVGLVFVSHKISVRWQIRWVGWNSLMMFSSLLKMFYISVMRIALGASVPTS
jgi:hypothetical protein